MARARRPDPAAGGGWAGRRFEVTVGPVAHGGHCVARHEGRVVFVRHTLPGERVLVTLTDTSHDRFWRGDATEVLAASPDRVPVRCPVAGPGLCGGCDFQHVDLAAQRRLKAAVVAEQLDRLAGIVWTGEVEALSAAERGTADDGLGWRTRMRYAVDDAGRVALRRHRSSELQPVPADGCPIAAPAVRVTGHSWPAGAELVAAASADGAVLLQDGRVERTSGEAAADGGLVERVAGRGYAVAADGFWQVHPAAAQTLVATVLAGLEPRPGEGAFDLYCGVGLFAGALVDAGCRVWGLEASRLAIAAARQNLADVGGRARFAADRVERGLAKLPARTDLVVLDPPRSGAGRAVVAAVLQRQPRAVAYVACDPAALARDLATATRLGYRVSNIRAFDLFPMTAHVECVALLHPA